MGAVRQKLPCHSQGEGEGPLAARLGWRPVLMLRAATERRRRRVVALARLVMVCTRCLARFSSSAALEHTGKLPHCHQATLIP